MGLYLFVHRYVDSKSSSWLQWNISKLPLLQIEEISVRVLSRGSSDGDERTCRRG